MAADKERVFVYGTLRRGFWNSFLLSNAERLGPARTRHRYALYVNRIPYAVRDEAVSLLVGEVYRVDGPTLAHIDGFKGHPYWYRRERVPVVLADGREVEAWLYFSRHPTGRLVSSGDYCPPRPAEKLAEKDQGEVGVGAYLNADDADGRRSLITTEGTEAHRGATKEETTKAPRAQRGTKGSGVRNGRRRNA
jgi:gamma-glutamylaminecyclotransferase